jgi:hypothetical protein
MNFAARDAAIASFRRSVCASIVGSDGRSLLPLRAQAEWQLASEGWTLESSPPVIGDYYHTILIPDALLNPFAMISGRREINGIPCSEVIQKITPRIGGAAHIVAALEAFKAGKSYWTALWTSGFAAIPSVKVQLVSLEYANAEMEFTYLAEMLLSDPPRGMGMPYKRFANDKRNGKMQIIIKNGTEFEVMSWNNKESLKGKKVIAYVYCEAYQLPDFSVYTTLAQNLRELRGFALFPTTPDRPWVGVFHDYGHGQDPDWHCTCSVDANENPFTFDQKARDRDDPEKGGIMTRERFAISWQGRLGRFIGRVYDFSRGDRERYFWPETHPYLWSDAYLDTLSRGIEETHAN